MFETLSAQALDRDHHAPHAANARASKKLEGRRNLVVRGQAGNFLTHLAGPLTSFTTVATTQKHHDSQLQSLESSTGDGGTSHNHELRLRTDSDVLAAGEFLAGEFPAGELISRLHRIDIFADVTLYVYRGQSYD